jgi:hypothetical protein
MSTFWNTWLESLTNAWEKLVPEHNKGACGFFRVPIKQLLQHTRQVPLWNSHGSKDAGI